MVLIKTIHMDSLLGSEDTGFHPKLTATFGELFDRMDTNKVMILPLTAHQGPLCSGIGPKHGRVRSQRF